MSSLSLRHPAIAEQKGFGLARRLGQWVEARRSRQALARLDTHLLKDIGLNPVAAQSEAQRPFWSL